MSTQLTWLWTLAVKKAITRFVQTFLAAYGTTLAGAGITVQEDALIAFLVGGLEFVRNWLKVRHGMKFL